MEWFFHALQDRAMSEDALRQEMKDNIRQLAYSDDKNDEDDQKTKMVELIQQDIIRLIQQDIKEDFEIQYLLYDRFGYSNGVNLAEWLNK